MEETKETDVSSIPEVPPNKKLKKTLSDKQRKTLEAGRKKRWLKKAEIRKEENITNTDHGEKETSVAVEEEQEQQEETLQPLQEEFEKKRYDEEPLRWTERLQIAEQEGEEKDSEEGEQEEESDQYEEGEQEDGEFDGGGEYGEESGSDQETSTPIRQTPYQLPKFQTPSRPIRGTVADRKIPSAPMKPKKLNVRDKVQNTLVERLVDRYLENKLFHTSDNKRLGEMMFY